MNVFNSMKQTQTIDYSNVLGNDTGFGEKQSKD